MSIVNKARYLSRQTCSFLNNTTHTRRLSGLSHTNTRNATNFASFNYQDPFNLNDQLDEDEILVRETAKTFAQEILAPKIIEQSRNESYDPDLIPQMGEYGLLGSTIEGYGCAGVSSVAYGLSCHEIEKIDSAYRSTLSVQSSLVMGPIAQFGSDALKEKYLPKLATGDLIGCFGLTEPDAGSDPAGMTTTCKLLSASDGMYEINGSKTWISHSPMAQVFVIWCKDVDSQQIKGFIVDKSEINKDGTLTCPKIEGKLSLRASVTGMIIMDNIRVHESQMLNVTGLKGPFSCLNNARFGIAWGALGAAQDCVDKCLDYTLNRKMFGHPLASYQLIQKRLAEIVSDVGIGMQACLRVGRLKDNNLLSPVQISIIKRNSCLKALDAARQCRDMLGGNGIIDEYHIMRHLCNLETVNTYEGTQDVHALIIGRATTGIQAFDHNASHDVA